MRVAGPAERNTARSDGTDPDLCLRARRGALPAAGALRCRRETSCRPSTLSAHWRPILRSPSPPTNPWTGAAASRSGTPRADLSGQDRRPGGSGQCRPPRGRSRPAARHPAHRRRRSGSTQYRSARRTRPTLGAHIALPRHHRRVLAGPAPRDRRSGSGAVPGAGRRRPDRRLGGPFPPHIRCWSPGRR